MTKDMTQGSPLKLILAFAVPLMLGSLFQQFYNLADTIIVGRFVGVEALAAVGSVGICVSLISLSFGNYPKPFHITYIHSRFAPAYPLRAHTWH